MTAPTPNLSLLPDKGFHSLQAWREHILALLLRSLVPLAAAVALPSIALAVVEDMWHIALSDAVALALLLWLWHNPRLSFRQRAWGFCGLLYLTGAAFLVILGAYSQIYLMACTAMAAILLGRKPALWALVLCTLTVFGIGYGLKQNAVVPGLEEQPLLTWIVMAVNFAFVNSVIDISIGMLLRGLERSLRAAHNSEERYRTAFAGSPDAMSIRRLSDGVYLDVNEGFLRQCGGSRAQVVGHAALQLKLWRNDADRLRMEEALLRDGEVLNLESEFASLDGRITPGLLSAHLLTLNGERCVLAVMRDISERKKTEAELQQYRHHLEELVAVRTAELERSNHDLAHQHEFVRMVTDSVPSLIAYWDTAQRCSFANRACAAFFGIPADKVLGTHARDMLGVEIFEDTRPYLQAATQGHAQRFDIALLDSQGQRRFLSVQYVPHRVEDRVAGLYVLADDVTDIQQAEQQLRGLNQELAVQVQSAQVANRAKSDFLANMSHEIRTPMNGVLGMVDVMQQSQLSPEQRRMLDTIQKSSVSLLNILNDILDYSKIEAGKLQVELVPTLLQEVAEGAVSLMEHAARAKHVSLGVQVSPTLPAWVLGDPLRLQQVLLNLLGNAVKFTTDHPHKPGRITLALQACALADGSAGVELRVSDTGIGMGQDMLDQLFQPFQQGDASTARRFGGTGLGLSITRQLVALMGGDIRVQSILGQGSDFVVTMPLRPCAPGQAHAPRNKVLAQATAVPSAEEAVRRGQLVLLAEDNETNQDVILQQLHLLGYAAEVAADGVEALDMLHSGRYALLLTDCHMPRMDGFTLTQRIRDAEAGRGSHLPIVAVTANAMQGEGQRCLDRGMDAYLAKPLRLQELGAVLNRWLPLPNSPLQRYGVDDAAREQEAATDGPAVVWNPDALTALVGSNPAVHQRLLHKFLEGARHYVPRIVAATQAGDATTVAHVAHTLKSSARSVGAMALGQCCQTLEAAGRAGDGALCQRQIPALEAAFAALLQAMAERVEQGQAP